MSANRAISWARFTINYAATVVVAAGTVLTADALLGLTLAQQLVLGIALAALVPLAFFRYSRSLWLSVDYLTSADERREHERLLRRPRSQGWPTGGAGRISSAKNRRKRRRRRRGPGRPPGSKTGARFVKARHAGNVGNIADAGHDLGGAYTQRLQAASGGSSSGSAGVTRKWGKIASGPGCSPSSSCG
jgi:hypothetical protein